MCATHDTIHGYKDILQVIALCSEFVEWILFVFSLYAFIFGLKISVFWLLRNAHVGTFSFSKETERTEVGQKAGEKCDE